jgi:hypothetical protein
MQFFSSFEGYLGFFMVIPKLKLLYIYSTIYCRTPKEVLPNHSVPQNHSFEMMTLAYAMNIEEGSSFETQVPLQQSTWRLIPEDLSYPVHIILHS